MPTFDATKKGYGNLWDACEVTQGRSELTMVLADKITANRPRYEQIELATRVPWWWIGPAHQREADMNFKCHLHNGDPLTGYTTHVPAGRPKVGHGPPFTWEESAIDALKLHDLDKVTRWTVERALYEWERYNGWGYYNKNINSPYVWSWTTLQQPGKYVADGKFDPKAMDQQPGCAAMLQGLVITLQLELPREGDAPQVA